MKTTTDVAQQMGTFLKVPCSVATPEGALFVKRPSGCLVIVPDRFRRGHWPRFRIGGKPGGAGKTTPQPGKLP